MAGRCAGRRKGSRSRLPPRPAGRPGTGRPPRPGWPTGPRGRTPARGAARRADRAADHRAAGHRAAGPGPDRLAAAVKPVDGAQGLDPVRLPAPGAPGPGQRRAGPPPRAAEAGPPDGLDGCGEVIGLSGKDYRAAVETGVRGGACASHLSLRGPGVGSGDERYQARHGRVAAVRSRHDARCSLRARARVS
jgi:hypothetical protein